MSRSETKKRATRLDYCIAGVAILALVAVVLITATLPPRQGGAVAEKKPADDSVSSAARRGAGSESPVVAPVGGKFGEGPPEGGTTSAGGDRLKTYPTADVRAMAVAATVQVVDRARGTSGSGVVIGVAGPFIYVLTANHLVSTEHSMEIRALDNQSPGGEVRIVSPPEVLAGEADVDLALLRVPASDWRPAAVRVCPPELVPREMGFSVVVTGWAGEATPGFRVAQVESRRQVRKSPESDAVWAWQTNEPHDRGDSGGAMVTAQGYLIGIASGVNEGKGYFAEAESMHRLLRQNGLKWLYEEPLTEFLQKNR